MSNLHPITDDNEYMKRSALGENSFLNRVCVCLQSIDAWCEKWEIQWLTERLEETNNTWDAYENQKNEENPHIW